ncbi:MAG: hypothetical protein LC135_05280 [Phycisphaerae bacterium]|nr:hypothetical protein [Phycisphaerae bacterium]MCZ2399266.1 hypothetical protein [Phycisphaerae bacterium]
MSGSPSEVCTKCGAAVAGTPYLVKFQVVCRRCHDLLQPQCPYCREYLKRSKLPERRSSFQCKACGGQITVDPHQWLFDTPYLTDEQAGYVGFVWQLDRWVFALGSRADYEKVRANLRQRFGVEPGIGDVIWGLMNESILALTEKHNAELAELRRTFGGRIPRDLGTWTVAKDEIKDVQKLMTEFRAFERDVKAARKGRPPRTEA